MAKDKQTEAPKKSVHVAIPIKNGSELGELFEGDTLDLDDYPGIPVPAAKGLRLMSNAKKGELDPKHPLVAAALSYYDKM